LFDTSDYPVALLVSQIFFQDLPDFLVALSVTCSVTVSAPKVQSISLAGFSSELAFFSPLLTLGAAFLLYAINRAMFFLITVVTSCHCLLVPYSQIGT